LQPGQVLLTGAIRRDLSERYFTSILMIDDEGRVLNSYDKWRLVPGGEFLPLAWALEPLGFRKLVNVPESFSPGEGPKTFDIKGFGPVGLLICYEAIFPDRLLPAAPRADWIVNVTNDGWFGLSSGPYQHVAQVRMRAIEQGLPIARAANTGISIVYDGFGQTIASLGLAQAGFVDAVLPEAVATIPFRRLGVWGSFFFVLLLCAIASLVELRSTRSTT
jgi:apolipoprotein N-acyltransferase